MSKNSNKPSGPPTRKPPAKPGTAGARGRDKLKQLLAVAVGQTGQTPAQFMQEIMQDQTQPVELRLQAARDLAPYVHKKQPVAVEVDTGGIPPLVVIVSPMTKTRQIAINSQSGVISAALEAAGAIDRDADDQ